MSEQDERKRFEEWCEAQRRGLTRFDGGNPEHTRDTDEWPEFKVRDYYHWPTEEVWRAFRAGWQARAAFDAERIDALHSEVLMLKSQADALARVQELAARMEAGIKNLFNRDTSDVDPELLAHAERTVRDLTAREHAVMQRALLRSCTLVGKGVPQTPPLAGDNPANNAEQIAGKPA